MPTMVLFNVSLWPIGNDMKLVILGANCCRNNMRRGDRRKSQEFIGPTRSRNNSARKGVRLVNTQTVRRGPQLLVPGTAVERRVRKKKPAQRTSKKSSARSGSALSLIKTPQGMKYLLGISHPHHEEARGVGIPDEECKSSFKTSGKGRLQIVVPVGNMTMVFIQGGCGNDSPMFNTVTGTVASFNAAGATYSTSTIPAGLTYSTVTNAALPFSTQTLYNDNAQWRCVSISARVRYTGNVMNRGGTAMWYEDTSGEGVFSLNDGTNTLFSALYNRWFGKTQTRFMSFINKAEHDIVYVPSAFAASGNPWKTGGTTFNAADQTWGVNPTVSSTGIRFGLSASGQNNEIPAGVFVLTNSTGTGPLEFTIEYIQHMEYSAQTLVGLQTRTYPAITDHQLISTALVESKSTHSQNPDDHPAEHLLKTLEGFGKDLASSSANAAAQALKTVFTPNNAAKLATGMAAMFL